MARIYVPDAGDIVWLSFNPQTGRGQAGHRPSVVDQKLPLRSTDFRCQAQRGSRGSGKKPRLAEKGG